MLIPNHVNIASATSTLSVPGISLLNASGLLVTSSASTNTYGVWTQLSAGLTYSTAYIIFRIAGTRTSADAIAASTLNSYVDIGVGPDLSNVTVVAEKLSGSNSSGMGAIWFLPLRINPDVPIWVRAQGTAASTKRYVSASFFGGQKVPASFPSCAGIVALGATTASTTGTTITPGASNAEGAWTQIVASSASDYAGLMLSHLFNVDTTLTTELIGCGDVAIGVGGSEVTVGENITYSHMTTANETRVSVHFPTWVSIPAATRIAARWSGSLAADGTNSIMVYGLMH